MLGLLNIIVALLICRNILCQPTVFTKQWYKDTNCITYENDILTTLEFILVDLQRLRFDTKQLKDDTTLIKTNLVRMKEDVNHIKTQSKKFIVTLNKFGNKLDITEVNKADMKDVLLELNKTVVRILNPMPCDITTPPPNLSTEINNTPAIRHENEIPNEIIVEPTTIKESDNDSMYFEKTENEIKNNVVRLPGAPGHDFKGVEDKINVVGGKESGKHYDKEEYDIEIESFSGEGGIVYAGSGRSGFDEERPETIAFQSDHINATFETNAKEKIASDSPKLNETVRHVGLGYNTISADAKGFDLPELGDATSGEDIFTGMKYISVNYSNFFSFVLGTGQYLLGNGAGAIE